MPYHSVRTYGIMARGAANGWTARDEGAGARSLRQNYFGSFFTQRAARFDRPFRSSAKQVPRCK